VIVNTIVIVRALLSRPDADVAIALGCFGGGSMIAALVLPRVLDKRPDRRVMLPAAALLGTVLLAFAGLLLTVAWHGADSGPTHAMGWVWPGLLVTWALLGLAYSALLTPTGRLLRRSAQAADRPALFAAQFALSHACWLLTYPLAGWLGSAAGMPVTLLVLGGLTLLGASLAAYLWPATDPEEIEHAHLDLGADHPHLLEHRGQGHRHAHPFVIDDLHREWPA
jgi:hypothetical protein